MIISVIIPTFNEEKTIVEILKKVKKQNKDDINLEVIVVDDCSTDNSNELLKQNSNLYTKLIELDENLVELIEANEVGTVLLSLIEIIGNDRIENIDEKRLYFISNTLNQINADLIRNKLLLKVLPLKV